MLLLIELTLPREDTTKAIPIVIDCVVSLSELARQLVALVDRFTGSALASVLELVQVALVCNELSILFQLGY